jgi:hypothetical protein
MRLRDLAIIFALLLGWIWASAQTYTFGFAGLGSGLYCNYEQLTYYGGGLWSGVDNLSACGFPVNATISGFTVKFPKTKPAVAHGPGVVYGDSIYATYSGDVLAQWTMYTKLKCNKRGPTGYIGPYYWEGVASFSGFLAGTNQGWLTCSIPGRNGVVPTLGVSTGAVRRQAGKK